MGKISTAGVLRLRATSDVTHDKSVRRFAQDDDFVGVSAKNIPDSRGSGGLEAWEDAVTTTCAELKAWNDWALGLKAGPECNSGVGLLLYPPLYLPSPKCGARNGGYFVPPMLPMPSNAQLI